MKMKYIFFHSKFKFCLKVLRVFICNKENDDVEKKKEKKCKNNGNKKDEVDYLQKIYNPSSNSLKDDEKNFISKLQMNLGLGTDKYKIL